MRKLIQITNVSIFFSTPKGWFRSIWLVLFLFFPSPIQAIRVFFLQNLWKQSIQCVHHPPYFCTSGPLNIATTEMTDGHIYIGRSARFGPSKWGNPFKGHVYGRKNAILKYEEYLFKSGLIKEIDSLQGLILVCHCAPLPCHGDILVKYMNKVHLKIIDE